VLPLVCDGRNHVLGKRKYSPPGGAREYAPAGIRPGKSSRRRGDNVGHRRRKAAYPYSAACFPVRPNARSLDGAGTTCACRMAVSRVAYGFHISLARLGRRRIVLRAAACDGGDLLVKGDVVEGKEGTPMKQHPKAKAMVLALTLSFLAHWIALPSQGTSAAGHVQERTAAKGEHRAARPLAIAPAVAGPGIAWQKMAMDTSSSGSPVGR
jgi:hypothetical protein